jgi:hypothetical protein
MPWNQAHAPLPHGELPKDTKRTWSEASRFNESRNSKNKTKQNKLPSFIDRLKKIKN